MVKQNVLMRRSVLEKGRDSYRADIMADWTAELDRAIERKFGVKAVTTFNVLAGPAGQFVTVRDDNERLTDEMLNFIDGFSTAVLWTANIQ